jgi:hypothetical protein
MLIMVCDNYVSSKVATRQDLSRATGNFKVHQEERREP